MIYVLHEISCCLYVHLQHDLLSSVEAHKSGTSSQLACAQQCHIIVQLN